VHEQSEAEQFEFFSQLYRWQSKTIDKARLDVKGIQTLQFHSIQQCDEIVKVIGVGLVLKRKRVDAIRSGWTPDSQKVKNVDKTHITDHFIRSVWTPSTPDYTSGPWL